MDFRGNFRKINEKENPIKGLKKKLYNIWIKNFMGMERIWGMKKKIKQKKFDIEAEFIGKSVGKKTKKEKKDDVTDEIKKFLDNPINLQKIKNIILRTEGFPISKEIIYDIKIYGLLDDSSISKKFSSFIIKIRKKNSYEMNFFLNSWTFLNLHWKTSEKLNSSLLKQSLRHEIYNWLVNNPNDVITVGNINCAE